jgi:transposase-like protein
MDNYSKMILGFQVAKRNNFEIVIASMTNALKVMRKHPGRKDGITMVTDGGKENHNHYVEAFLDKLIGFKISKKWAIRQLRVSNSPVEAIHRTMKGRYLRNQKFESIKSLKKYLEWAVNDYNKVRPHYKFRPRTPYEMYFEIPLGFDIKKRAKEAVQNRVKKNKCAKCIQCKDVFKPRNGSKTCANPGNCDI